MAQHIVSHGKIKGKFRMDKYLRCGFLECQDENDPDATYVFF